MSTEKLWAIRTIRRGKVRIHGRDYKPQSKHIEYDGRLDGMRYLFGLYGYNHSIVTLAGPHPFHPNVKGPEVVDGILPWLFWDVIQ